MYSLLLPSHLHATLPCNTHMPVALPASSLLPSLPVSPQVWSESPDSHIRSREKGKDSVLRSSLGGISIPHAHVGPDYSAGHACTTQTRVRARHRPLPLTAQLTSCSCDEAMTPRRACSSLEQLLDRSSACLAGWFGRAPLEGMTPDWSPRPFRQAPHLLW